MSSEMENQNGSETKARGQRKVLTQSQFVDVCFWMKKNEQLVRSKFCNELVDLISKELGLSLGDYSIRTASEKMKIPYRKKYKTKKRSAISDCQLRDIAAALHFVLSTIGTGSLSKTDAEFHRCKMAEIFKKESHRIDEMAVEREKGAESNGQST